MKLISSAFSEHLILNMEMRFNQYYIVKIGFRKIKAFSVLAPLLVKWCPLHINDRLQLWIQNVHEVMKLFQWCHNIVLIIPAMHCSIEIMHFFQCKCFGNVMQMCQLGRSINTITSYMCSSDLMQVFQRCHTQLCICDHAVVPLWCSKLVMLSNNCSFDIIQLFIWHHTIVLQMSYNCSFEIMQLF